ncbi:MAG: tetratricopeptide repeat protein [Planctomycetaceae bacterium]|nr:tetratricopeptide repeat protein [Planctomycetaceae bacterium]
MNHKPLEFASAPRRVLNLKAIAILVGGLFALRSAIGWVHGRQIDGRTTYLRSAAEAALEKGEVLRAVDWYDQYLSFRPGDRRVQESVASLLSEQKDSAALLLRAFQMNERLLLADRSRDDIRLRQIELAAQLNRVADVSGHLKHLRSSQPDVASVWHYSGVLARDTGDRHAAEDYFSRAIRLPDPPPEAFGFLAQLYAQQSSEDGRAEELMNRMVELTDSAESRRIRATWLTEQQRYPDAMDDLQQALEFEPDDAVCTAMLLKTINTLNRRDRNFDSAIAYGRLITHLRQRLKLKPEHSGLRLYLASALRSAGDHSGAIRVLEEGIAVDPRRAEFSEMLVDYLVSDHRWQQAQEVFDHIPERAIGRGRREFMRGRLLMAQKRWTEAMGALEMAIGYATRDTGLGARARTCLAICRREAGDPAAAIDAYRSLIQTHPEFEEGRIGMASAYLRADQTDLAIAEYRQLLHVDGVPEFLAHLLIRYNLDLPVHRRDWSEVTDLLRDRNPYVTDDAQRTLLQADLLFAQGHPARAMQVLDRAAKRLPDRPEIGRAFDRLASPENTGFQERLTRLFHEDPANAEAHICALRLKLGANDAAGAELWLDELAAGRSFLTLSERVRLELVTSAVSDVLGRDPLRLSAEVREMLIRRGESAGRRLAALSSEHVWNLVRFVAQYRSAEAAIEVLTNAGTLPAAVSAVSWLECLRFGTANPRIQQRVTGELIRLIQQDPADMGLRLAYAESRLLLTEYEEAETLFRQIAEYDNGNATAYNRLAWLALCVRHDSQEALQYSLNAARLMPSDPSVRSVRGLALAEARQTREALDVLTSIPAAQRTPASYLYEARALFLDGRRRDAESIVQDLVNGHYDQELAPAEGEILRSLRQDLQVRRCPGDFRCLPRIVRRQQITL